MNFATVKNVAGATFTGDQWACGLPTYNALYAGYLLGTDFWAGTPYTPVKDISGNGRNLTLTGTCGAKALTGPANYATCPFSSDTIFDATGDVMTMIVIANVANGTRAFPVGNRSTGSTKQWAAFEFTSASQAVKAVQRNLTAEQSCNSSALSSVRTGHVFAAGVFRRGNGGSEPGSTQLFHTYPGSVELIERPVVVTPAMGSSASTPSDNIRIGNDYSANTGTHDVAAVLIYSRKLSKSEIEAVRASLFTLLTSGGVTVSL